MNVEVYRVAGSVEKCVYKSMVRSSMLTPTARARVRTRGVRMRSDLHVLSISESSTSGGTPPLPDMGKILNTERTYPSGPRPTHKAFRAFFMYGRRLCMDGKNKILSTI